MAKIRTVKAYLHLLELGAIVTVLDKMLLPMRINFGKDFNLNMGRNILNGLVPVTHAERRK